MALGLLAGLAVSTFSKTLALLFGLLVFGVQVRIVHICREDRLGVMDANCASYSSRHRKE